MLSQDYFCQLMHKVFGNMIYIYHIRTYFDILYGVLLYNRSLTFSILMINFTDNLPFTSIDDDVSFLHYRIIDYLLLFRKHTLTESLILQTNKTMNTQNVDTEKYIKETKSKPAFAEF